MRARHLSVVVATVCGAVLVALVVVPRYAALLRQPCYACAPAVCQHLLGGKRALHRHLGPRARVRALSTFERGQPRGATQTHSHPRTLAHLLAKAMHFPSCEARP